MTHAQLAESLAASVAMRGSLLYHLDLARHLAARALRGAAGGRWAVDVGIDGYEAIVIDETGAARARITFDADGTPIVEARDGIAEPRLMSLAQAYDCAQRFGTGAATTIILPPPRGSQPDRIEAYRIALEDAPGDIRFGGHHHGLLSADGRRALSWTPVGRSDLVVAGVNGRPARDILVTHDGDAPDPTHVYQSLRHGVAFDVLTTGNDWLWHIDGETVRISPGPAHSS